MRNKYKVAKNQWKKWNEDEQALFISLYEFSIMNPWIFSHPKAPNVSKDHWNTVAWNHAWMAADLARELRKTNAKLA